MHHRIEVGDVEPAGRDCAEKLEATKRLMNIQLEKNVMASLDYANLAEYVSFGTADFNKIVDGLVSKS